MKLQVCALPDSLEIALEKTAVIVIDMQKDFILNHGFGESLGNEVARLQSAIQPCTRLLDWARKHQLLVIHTREGHSSNLSNVFKNKLQRGKPSKRIGDEGPMGKILIRGEDGHDFVDDLRPLDTEVVIEKAGKGAFFATELDLVLRKAEIQHLIFAGVTTEVCVSSTVREANDRGYDCLVVEECCASYFPDFHRSALDMICAQGGIFGFVCHLNDIEQSKSNE